MKKWVTRVCHRSLSWATFSLFILVLAGWLVISYQFDIRTAYRQVEEGSMLVETPYGRVEYAEMGEGPPVLLLHGAGGGYDQGLLLGNFILGDKYRIIAPSRFGFLLAEVPEDYSLEVQADALAALMDKLGLERVSVLSVSAGGPAGLYFAQHHPERTSALIMASAISYTIALQKEDIKKLALIHRIIGSDFIYWIMLKAARNPMLKLLGVPHEVLNTLDKSDRLWVNQALDSMLPMSLRFPGILIDESRQIPSDFSYDQIVAPTLVLHARDDTLVPVEQGINTSVRISQAEILIFEQGGHFLLGNTERVTESINRFLEENW